MTPDPHAPPPSPANAEARLEQNRARMRARLAPKQEGIAGAANRALPQAREVVRRHPYASVAAAAVAGALLARRTSWRSLRGSPLVGTIARQALALSGVAGVAGAGGLLNRLAHLALNRHGERGRH